MSRKQALVNAYMFAHMRQHNQYVRKSHPAANCPAWTLRVQSYKEFLE